MRLKQLKTKDLVEMLGYCRPAWSDTEAEFIARYIDPVPGVYADQFGNRLLPCADSKLIIACHTDTVHRKPGRQRVVNVDGVMQLPLVSPSNCLGADDTAGVYAALRMIQAGVKATYIFHRAEEIGGQGSDWLARNYAAWIAQHTVCLSLDRRGYADIITSQWGGRTASDAFALSLARELNMGHKPTAGIFTDSANYAHLIPECSNISVGYQHEHSALETLNLTYLERLVTRLCAVNWDALTVERDPDMPEPDPDPLPRYTGFSRHSGGSGRTGRGSCGWDSGAGGWDDMGAYVAEYCYLCGDEILGEVVHMARETVCTDCADWIDLQEELEAQSADVADAADPVDVARAEADMLARAEADARADMGARYEREKTRDKAIERTMAVRVN